MTHFLAALVVAATLASGAAYAGPSTSQMAGAAQGQITPHGIWDAR